MPRVEEALGNWLFQNSVPLGEAREFWRPLCSLGDAHQVQAEIVKSRNKRFLRKIGTKRKLQLEQRQTRIPAIYIYISVNLVLVVFVMRRQARYRSQQFQSSKLRKLGGRILVTWGKT